jgi:hypothetical protein
MTIGDKRPGFGDGVSGPAGIASFRRGACSSRVAAPKPAGPLGEMPPSHPIRLRRSRGGRTKYGRSRFPYPQRPVGCSGGTPVQSRTRLTVLPSNEVAKSILLQGYRGGHKPSLDSRPLLLGAVPRLSLQNSRFGGQQLRRSAQLKYRHRNPLPARVVPRGTNVDAVCRDQSWLLNCLPAPQPQLVNHLVQREKVKPVEPDGIHGVQRAKRHKCRCHKPHSRLLTRTK